MTPASVGLDRAPALQTAINDVGSMSERQAIPSAETSNGS